MAALRRELVTATGARKRGLVRQLRTAECRAADTAFRAAEESARARIHELLETARSVDLFGERRRTERELRAPLAEARAGLRAIRGARRSIVREREVPWFHYQSHFADVFAGRRL